MCSTQASTPTRYPTISVLRWSGARSRRDGTLADACGSSGRSRGRCGSRSRCDAAETRHPECCCREMAEPPTSAASARCLWRISLGPIQCELSRGERARATSRSRTSAERSTIWSGASHNMSVVSCSSRTSISGSLTSQRSRSPWNFRLVANSARTPQTSPSSARAGQSSSWM